mmetsp:Transcript_54946/g.163603  ORF Transcript_54946/g.163603 Transcript_54946/m.163603 type:complete len:247 (-) Transcript_54946:152-892(-)
MNICTCALEGSRWKNRSVMGTWPRAPWSVALGSVARKQKNASETADSLLALKQAEHVQGLQQSVHMVTRRIPRKRMLRPTTRIGRTRATWAKTLMSVLLPSMLKRMSWPNTQTPPMVSSVACKTSGSATRAKRQPMTMTMSSGWKREPGANPMGTNGGPFSALLRPKPARAVASRKRKPSTVVPLKGMGSRERLEMNHPAPAPAMAPTPRVARSRKTLARTRVFTLAVSSPRGSATPETTPKSISA